MKFFQKRGVAITITLILIVAALLIGKPWASSNTATASAANSDYLSYIADDANALTNDARSKVADYMETLDSKYGSIVALMTITDTDGETMEDYAKSVWDEAEFLDSDMLLVVNTETGECETFSNRASLNDFTIYPVCGRLARIALHERP